MIKSITVHKHMRKGKPVKSHTRNIKLNFYDLRQRKKFSTDQYTIKNKNGRRFAVAKAPSGIDSYSMMPAISKDMMVRKSFMSRDGTEKVSREEGAITPFKKKWTLPGAREPRERSLPLSGNRLPENMKPQMKFSTPLKETDVINAFAEMKIGKNNSAEEKAKLELIRESARKEQDRRAQEGHSYMPSNKPAYIKSKGVTK